MATPPTNGNAPRRGPSVAQLAKELAVPRLAPNNKENPNTGLIGPAQAPVAQTALDELREAQENRVRNRIANAQLEEIEMETETKKANLEAIKADAELKRAQAQSKLQELINAAKEQEGSGGIRPETAVLIELLSNQLERAQSQLQVQGIPQEDSRLGAFLERLTSEMDDMREQIKAIALGDKTGDPKDVISDNLKTLVDLKGLMDTVFPRENHAPSVSKAREDLELTMLAHRNELMMAEFRHKMDMDRMRLESETQLKTRELEVAETRNKNLSQGLNGLVEQFGPLVKELADNLLVSKQQAPPIAAYQVPAVFEPQVAAVPLASTTPQASAATPTRVQVSCVNEECHELVWVVEGQEQVTCGSCGTIQSVSWSDQPWEPGQEGTRGEVGTFLDGMV